jgi:hypothetical protein
VASQTHRPQYLYTAAHTFVGQRLLVEVYDEDWGNIANVGVCLLLLVVIDAFQIVSEELLAHPYLRPDVLSMI